MNTWAYRVVHELVDNEHCYDIRECHYEKGVLQSYTMIAVAPFGETVADLEGDLRLMLAALKKGVLELSELPGASE